MKPGGFSLFCDNYATCNSARRDSGSKESDEARARAGGWHIFEGFTIGGVTMYSVLCPKCANNRKPSQMREVPPGSVALF